MGYSILLIISICLTPSFGSNTLETFFPSTSRARAIIFSANPAVQTDVSTLSQFPSKLYPHEGFVDKIKSVLSIAKRTESKRFHPVKLAGEIFEQDEAQCSYRLGEYGLDVFDKTDIIYFLVTALPDEVETRANMLLSQCGRLSNHKNELQSLWGRPYDLENFNINYFKFLDDLRDEMVKYLKILDDLRNKTLSNSKPIRRCSEPNKRVSFNLSSAPVALQRTTSDQYSFFDSVRRRFSYQQGNNPST